MYAGDLDPKKSYALLAEDAQAQLVDVRTQAEWAFVGRPDLIGLGKQVHCISWQDYPTMALNTHFVEALNSLGLSPTTPLLFLCRSGQRSRAAAEAATAAGYASCYNVAEGFEGNCDDAGHRGTVGGWKCAGLPWKQP